MLAPPRMISARPAPSSRTLLVPVKGSLPVGVVCADELTPPTELLTARVVVGPVLWLLPGTVVEVVLDDGVVVVVLEEPPPCHSPVAASLGRTWWSSPRITVWLPWRTKTRP